MRPTKKVLATLAALAVTTVAGGAGAVKMEMLEVGAFAVENGVFNTIFAKEMCSCHFVDGIELADCKARDNLPKVANIVTKVQIDEATHTVHAELEFASELARLVPPEKIGGPAEAAYDPQHPELGCTLTKLPSDRR